MPNPSSHGHKIGPRIAVIVSQAIVATHHKLIGAKHKLAMIIFRAISDEISEEVDHTLGPILRDMKAQYGEDGPMASFLDFMASGHGQWKAIVGTAASASGILSSVALILNNELYPAVYQAIASNPHSVPDQATAAQMGASGVLNQNDAAFAIAKNGYDRGWADAMIELERQYPQTADALDLRRRGLISDADLDLALQRSGLPTNWIGAVRGLLVNPISPADAALAVLRNNMTLADAQRISEEWGITPQSLDILIGNTGEPLGLEQLLEAKRRGFIDDATLVRGILQSRVRDEWISTAEKLAYSPISVADAVNAVVQNQLAFADGDSISQQNGLEPGNFQTLVNTAGEPISRGEMFELFNRGLATRDQVIQAERESRLKNKYNELAFNLHERLLEPRMLSSAVEFGSVTHDRAIAEAEAYGYDAERAGILIGEGAARKLQTYKAKVVTSLETLYEDGAIDNATAQTAIVALGFDATEATFILEAADMRRATKQMSQVISAIRGKFLGRHVDDKEASSLLSTAGVPTSQIAFLMSEWEIERQSYTRQLTEAQIVKAVKLQLITPDDGANRLVNMGYSSDDATLLIEGA